MPYLKRSFCKISFSCSITMTEEYWFYYYKKQGYKASPLKRSLSQSLCFQIIKKITLSNIALNSTIYAIVEIIGHHNIDISQTSYGRSNQYKLLSLCLPLHTVATVNMQKLTTHNPLKTPASHLQFNAEDIVS